MLSKVLPDIHGHDMPSVGGHALLHLNRRLLLVFGGKPQTLLPGRRRCYSRPPKLLGRVELLDMFPTLLTPYTLTAAPNISTRSTPSGCEDVIIHYPFPQQLFGDCHSHSWRKPSPANLSRSPRDNEKPECRSCDALRRV
jgi:hypothetical protein